jgi:TRAP-type uncharacterized transport system substrate-binding protein
MAAFREMTIETMQKALDSGVVKVPVHPGARRYFEEKGVKFPASVPK